MYVDIEMNGEWHFKMMTCDLRENCDNLVEEGHVRWVAFSLILTLMAKKFLGEEFCIYCLLDFLLVFFILTLLFSLPLFFFPHFTDEETEVLGNYLVSGK